jgi:phosphate acetyltransferase
MPHNLFLAPVGSGCGLTSLALGLVRALDNQGIRVAFCKPIGQPVGEDSGPERSTHFIRATTALKPGNPIPLDEAERSIAGGGEDELMERVVRLFHESSENADVVVVEGLVPQSDSSYTASLNILLARTLGAEIILAASASQLTPSELDERIEIAAKQYGGIGNQSVIGCIINRVPCAPNVSPGKAQSDWMSRSRLFGKRGFQLIGTIPENPELSACRTIDICRHLGARVVREGEIMTRRSRKISLLARTVPKLMHSFAAGTTLITPSDRSDVILGVAMAALNKIPMAGLILTGDMELEEPIMQLCRPAWETGLPVLHVPTNSWETATILSRMSTEIPPDDIVRVQLVMDHVARHIDTVWIAAHASLPVETRMSPAAFRFRLGQLAGARLRRIVLPEGEEPRTVRAAFLCAERGIARCVLLGNPETIRQVAKGQGIELPEIVEIVDPAPIRDSYVDALVEMRKTKGLTRAAAAELLEDPIWVGTMMLSAGEVDGLVSGAVHSTAAVLRPALQVIRTKADVKVVSSVFFMCMPEQVFIYGDCAVNPDPDAETLADIAIQSAESAQSLGITPRVAMISYSTGESGSGVGVDKVREATAIARAKRPDLVIDGPLQYDAAAIPEVAAQKAPGSPVAGKATVFIFPDLNTGNTTYKAVQRSAGVISIGPMLQGLKHPVNDLSRGALVEDIVYTIALTAIQAGRP